MRLIVQLRLSLVKVSTLGVFPIATCALLSDAVDVAEVGGIGVGEAAVLQL